MKLKKLNSKKEINVNIVPYLVDWDEKVGSKFQFSVKTWLKKYWKSHVCLEEFKVPGSRYRFDFINLTKRVIVESNGEQHDEFNEHFHRGSRTNFLESIKRDQAKKDWVAQNDFIVVEILPSDLPLTLSFFKENYDLDIN